VIENLRSGIEWAQGLSAVPKGVISAVIVLVCGLILVILWQKPTANAPKKAAASGASQTTHQSTAAHQGGIGNQLGNAASTSQSGGVTAGLYINQAPPVTEQQKEEALSRLRSEIGELADFPKRPDIPELRTLLEQVSTNTMPHQLFVILNKYYKQTITSIPSLGGDLYKYKTEYYNFENAEYDFENELTMRIGKTVTVRFRQAWSIYFRYFLLRSAGLTQTQIIDGGNFLNYDITWDDAERVFSELTRDKAIAPAMAEKFDLQQKMLTTATGIIDTYKRL
jgi:hypothetical protein